jgi:hypothetical protein
MHGPLKVKKRKLLEGGGKECMNIKGWFKPIFPLFIAGLFDLTAYIMCQFCVPPTTRFVQVMCMYILIWHLKLYCHLSSVVNVFEMFVTFLKVFQFVHKLLQIVLD